MKSVLNILYCLLIIVCSSCQDKEIDPDLTVAPGPCDDSPNASLLIPASSAAAGAEICIPVRTKNFSGITAFMGAVKWDPAVLSYTRLVALSLQGEVANFNNAPQGTINYLWMDNTAANPITVAEDQSLFQVCYNVVGSSGQTTSVEIAATPSFVVEVVDSTGAVIPHCSQKGTFTVK